MPAMLFADLPRPLKEKEIQRLEDNIKKNPKNTKSRQFLAEHFASKKNWQEVIRVLAPATERLADPQILTLGKAYLELKDARGVGSLKKIITNQNKMNIDRYLLLVRIQNLQAEQAPTEAMKSERVKDSINMLKTAQVSKPGNQKIYDLWIETLEKFIPYFQYDALVVLEKMKKAGLEFSPHHYSLMCKYNYLAGYSKQTIHYCKEATRVDEENPINWIYLGKTHIASGEKSRGQRMIASVGKKYSHSEEALWATAHMYHESKDLPAAYQFYKKASAHKHAKPRDYLGLAIVAFDLKKYQEALTFFKKHCSSTKILHHEFRRASGLLKSRPLWQKKYRSAMYDCNK